MTKYDEFDECILNHGVGQRFPRQRTEIYNAIRARGYEVTVRTLARRLARLVTEGRVIQTGQKQTQDSAYQRVEMPPQ